MNQNEIIKEFFEQKNYGLLKEKFPNSENSTELYYLARVYLEEKDYTKAAILFSRAGYKYEQGRCELLLGNLEKAKSIWRNIEEESSLLNWGKSITEFIELYVVNIPSFFQIRAFLEVDLDALLKANQIEYCENIVNGAHLFAKNNQESYKFIARVFMNNTYYDLAKIFLNKAKDVCYIDPEIHFMLAKYYLEKNDIKKAIQSLNISIEKGYGYYPAKKMLESLKK